MTGNLRIERRVITLITVEILGMNEDSVESEMVNLTSTSFRSDSPEFKADRVASSFIMSQTVRVSIKSTILFPSTSKRSACQTEPEIFGELA